MPEGISTREQVEKFENVVILERPEARYRIVYEKHNLPHSIEEIGKPDILVIEYFQSGREFREDAPAAAVSEYSNARSRMASKEEQAKFDESREYLQQNKIPICLIDISESGTGFGKKVKWRWAIIRTAEMVLSGLAINFIGIDLLKKFIDKRVKKLEKEKEAKMSRRDFLKFLGAGSVAAYGGTHYLDAALISASPEGSSGHLAPSAASRKMRQIQETVHQETEALTLTLRNAVWAQKLQTIAADIALGLDRKPEIAMQAGAMHTGLEDMLAKKPEERIKIIKDIMKKFGPDKEVDLASIVRANLWGGSDFPQKIDLIRDPELEKLEKELWPKNE